jgi:hypothetical protein
MRIGALCTALLVFAAVVGAVPAHAAAATFTNPLNSTGPDP